MKCPLLLAGNFARGTLAPSAKCDCLKENCAWWLKGVRQCAVLHLAVELNELRKRAGGRRRAVQQP